MLRDCLNPESFQNKQSNTFYALITLGSTYYFWCGGHEHLSPTITSTLCQSLYNELLHNINSWCSASWRHQNVSPASLW